MRDLLIFAGGMAFGTIGLTFIMLMAIPAIRTQAFQQGVVHGRKHANNGDHTD